MKKVRRFAALLGGVVFFALVAELILHALPVFRPTAMDGGFGDGHFAGHLPHSAFVYSRDWDLYMARSGTINGRGLHGHCMLEHGAPDVLITGDSYTEALMLEPHMSVGAELQALVRASNKSVCAVGMSGASAAEQLSQWDSFAKPTTPSVWVSLLSRSDFAESFGGRAGLAKFPLGEGPELIGDRYERPAVLERLMPSALFRYVYYNLDAKGMAARLRCRHPMPACDGSGDDSVAVQIALDRFMKGMMDRAGTASLLIVVANDTMFQGKKGAEDSRFWDAFAASRPGQRVVLVRTSRVLTPGACRERPCFLFRDGHWTAWGHQLVSRAVEAEIRKMARSSASAMAREKVPQ
jgi:hypothetical protein